VADLTIPYDPAKAKTLLQQANAVGFAPNVISFDYPGIPQTQQVLQAIAGYWEAVGLKPKLTPMDRLAFREFWLKDQTNGMMWAWANTANPTFQTRFQKFYYSKDIGFNIYTDAKLDGIYEQLINTSATCARSGHLSP
jgi:ABC-type transport system substrate-binding protein